MKILCETTGDFMLIDYAAGQSIEAHRPSVVTKSSFVNQRSMIGQITKLADLNDEATDEEFVRYLKDAEDMELAIAAFVETFGIKHHTTKVQPELPPAEPVKKPRRSKRTKES